MQKLEIKGGRKISGTIIISGSKNATLPILASTILTNKKIIITMNLRKQLASAETLYNKVSLQKQVGKI